MLDIDEHARVVLGYLVEQYRPAALGENDGAVGGDRERRVLENGADEVALGGRFTGGLAHDDVAEVGETPVGDNN